MTAWHLLDEDLDRYVTGTAPPPLVWSVEAHLLACAACRAGLAASYPGTSSHPATSDSWQRLDIALDEPRLGRVEALLVRLGVSDVTARLLAATWVLRTSWFAAVVVTLALVAAVTQLSPMFVAPLPFLAVAPLVPVAGVAATFHRGVDPTRDIAVVAPISTFRLAVLRSVAVAATSTVVISLATLALPRFGAAALAWLVPAWALTALCLTLLRRLTPIWAAATVGVGWLLVLALISQPRTGTSALFGAAGQLVVAGLGLLAAAVFVLSRTDMERVGR